MRAPGICQSGTAQSTSRLQTAFARASTICGRPVSTRPYVSNRGQVRSSSVAKVPLRTLRGCPAQPAIFRAPLWKAAISTTHLRAHHPKHPPRARRTEDTYYRRRYLHSIADPIFLIREANFSGGGSICEAATMYPRVVDIKEQRPEYALHGKARKAYASVGIASEAP